MIVTIKMTVAAHSASHSAPAARPRVAGLDLARALAILGMVIVNYEIAMNATGRGPGWLGTLTGALQGRAAATFVVLAGIGASLGAARARASGDPADRRAARLTLLRRGAFLFVLGTLFLPVWPADILHFYGVYLALGSVLLFARASLVVCSALLLAAGAVAFLVFGDYFAHWNLVDFSYRGLGTLSGFLRNLFLDGWHPVLPWAVLYLVGLLLGRASLGERGWRRQIGIVAAVVLIAGESAAHFLAPQGIETPGLGALLATESVPPTPGYLVAGSATAVLVIVSCCELVDSLPGKLLQPLESTGRLALSFYLGHVLIGLGFCEALGRLENQSLPFAVTTSLIFFAACVLFAWLWCSRFKRGPLESLMRRVAG